MLARCYPAHLRLYRYRLELRLADAGPRLAIVLKNPSTATAEKSDPTIGKLTAWARRRGFGALVVVNLFALRGTRPEAVNTPAYGRAVGSQNDRHLLAAARAADAFVAAWGNPNGIDPGRYHRRIAEVLGLLEGRELYRVGPLTRRGYPRHGLWWTDRMALIPFDISR